MARIAALREVQSSDHCRFGGVRYEHGPDVLPIGDALTEQILEHTNTVRPEERRKRTTSPPNIRWDKVLDIRRRIAEGTYEMAHRVDGVIGRVLKAIAT